MDALSEAPSPLMRYFSRGFALPAMEYLVAEGKAFVRLERAVEVLFRLLSARGFHTPSRMSSDEGNRRRR